MNAASIWGPASDSILVVGLTGGIASGKTEVDRELERLGATVVDADSVARDVVEPGSPAFEKIVEEFGPGVVGGDGRLDRESLGREVFSDESKRLRLNEITHPAIFQELVDRVQAYASSLGPGDPRALVIDAALIVDVGVAGMFDMLLAVTSDEELRLKRLVDNRCMDSHDAEERIRSQIPDGKRLAQADIVIENNGTLGDLRATVAGAWKAVLERAEERFG